MKNILMIGLGQFGHHLCRRLYELGNQVMIADSNEDNIQDLLPYVTNAVIGDCTKPEVLEELGVRNFDIVFVCIGSNFQNGLEITSQVKEMGAPYVVSKVTRDLQAKFMLRNGADEIIYPDKDVAEKAALHFGTEHVLDNLELTDDCSIYEITVPDMWANRTVRELNIRAKYNVSILGIKNEKHVKLNISPKLELKKDMHLLIIGHNDDLQKLRFLSE